MGDLVQDMPRDDHGHDDGLARAGRHLGAQAPEVSAVRGNVDADLVGGGRLGEPDQRLGRLDLAEEKPPSVEFLRVRPVLQQSLRDSGNTRMSGFPPRSHARAEAVDQRDLDEHARIVECPGAFRRHDVASGTAAVRPVEQARGAVVAPVFRRFLPGRVDDQLIDGPPCHYSASGGTSGSRRAINAGRLFCTVSHTRPTSISK